MGKIVQFPLLLYIGRDRGQLIVCNCMGGDGWEMRSALPPMATNPSPPNLTAIRNHILSGLRPDDMALLQPTSNPSIFLCDSG